MHTVVLRRSLYEAQPWIATSLYAAFAESKAVVDNLYAYWESTLHRLLMIPWVTELRRKNRELTGDDCWPYGIEPNRKALETAIRYHVEQGLSRERIAVEELFAQTV
jgi:4,5-dihydroxyphthalate decarboxylase